MFHDAFGKFVNPQSQTSHQAPELPRFLTFAWMFDPFPIRWLYFGICHTFYDKL